MSRNSVWEAYPSVERLRALLAVDGSFSLNSLGADGHALIHRAAIDNNTGIIKLVKECGGDINILDRSGKSALNLSIEKRLYDAFELLLKLGADPNNATVLTESTLHQAAAIPDSRFLKLLYEKGARCVAADKLNDWPIHRATLEEYQANVGIILHSDPEHVNANGNRGLTPLHIAAANGDAELFAILFMHGADIAAKDVRGLTPLDVVIKNQENAILDTFGYLLANKVIKCPEAKGFKTVFDTDAAKTFLETLMKVDNEYRRAFIATEELEYFENQLDDATNEALLGYIESDERIDINEFVQIIVKAIRNGLIDEIIEKNLVPKISEAIFRHVLMSENEALLQELMNLGVLWAKIVTYLESNIVHAYERTLVAKRVGIKGLVWRECLIEEEENQSEGSNKDVENKRVSYDKLHFLLSKITKLWQLRHNESMSDSNENCDLVSSVEAMKDPLQSLALWSVLTGRFKLTPHLLRQEPYDIIPQTLLVVKLLRALSKLKGIEDVYRNKAETTATTCEGIAIQALRRIKEFDTSQNNILTMEYLRLPLPSYGDYDVIDLAARGESSNFVTIDVVQDTLDMFWYSDLFFVRNKVFKMEGTIVLGFIPPFMLLLPMIMERFRKSSPTFKNPEALQDSKFAQVKSALRSHHKTHDHGGNSGNHHKNEAGGHQEMSSVGERLLPPEEAYAVRRKPVSYFSRVFTELNAFYGIPCVKFRFHVAAHILFVLLMSNIVMRTFDHDISVWEWICYSCLFGFLVEEVNEIIKSRKDESLASYFSDGWNLIDLTAIMCGLLSFLLRIEYKPGNKEFEARSESVRYASLVLLSTTCLIYWIRLLFVSVILQSLGPKLKMMALMVKKDFLPFLYILFILMVGFGVVFQALLYPPFRFGESSTLANETAQEIAVRMFKTTFFMIVGEYGLDAKEPCSADGGAESPEKLKDCVNETGSLLVTNVFMVIYIIIVQILLLNVIVAMFSETIEAVNSESTAMWQFEKYDLTQEFFMRSKLPPPLNVLLELRRVLAWVVRKIRNGKSAGSRSSSPAKNEKKRVEIFLYYLYYQAIGCRGQRATFNGVVIDEEDLDEGNKIIHSQIKDIKKELSRLRNLETMVHRMTSSKLPLTRPTASVAIGTGAAGQEKAVRETKDHEFGSHYSAAPLASDSDGEM